MSYVDKVGSGQGGRPLARAANQQVDDPLILSHCWAHTTQRYEQARIQYGLLSLLNELFGDKPNSDDFNMIRQKRHLIKKPTKSSYKIL